MKKRNGLGFIFIVGIVGLVLFVSGGYAALTESGESADKGIDEIDPKEVEELSWNEISDFTAVGKGYGKNDEIPVEVEVTFLDGEITDIEILSHEETAGMSDDAFDLVPPKIIEEQSIEVDVASGATYTSEAIKQGVANAIASEGN